MCCGKVQAAGLAACSECKTPFVCLYKDSLYIPVLGIARNDTDCVQLISNVLTKGLNLFPIKDGLQKAGYPNDVSGVRIASSSVGGTTDKVSGGDIKATLFYGGHAHERSQKTLLRRANNLCMKNIHKWQNLELETQTRLAKDGVEPAFRRKASVVDWSSSLSFPSWPYGPTCSVEQIEWKRWKESSAIRNFNALELELIQLAYRNYLRWERQDVRFKEYMFVHVLEGETNELLLQSLDQHLC